MTNAGKKWRVSCCNSVIQSMDVHHTNYCRCGKSFIDGGSAYDRQGWEEAGIVFTEVTEKDDDDE